MRLPFFALAISVALSPSARAETPPTSTPPAETPVAETPAAAPPAVVIPADHARPTDVTGLTPVLSLSGLKYYVLRPGVGTPVHTGQVVKVHYAGFLTDGTMFDSSYGRGRPFEFLLGAGRVIKGWDEGVAGMRPGEVRQLIVPSSLGYGLRGVPGMIPPAANLVFDVELIGPS